MEIINFKLMIFQVVADFDLNRSWSWEIKQKLPHPQPASEQNRFLTMLLN